MTMNELGLIRDIDDSEVEMMLGWRNQPYVRANMFNRHEISRDEHFAWWAKAKHSSECKHFMFELGGKPCGIVGLSAINTAHKNAAWLMYAAPEAPRGAGLRMSFHLFEYAFTQVQLHKLIGEILAFNSTAGYKYYEKFGFRLEGVLRQEHHVDQQFVDIYRIGMLASEWRERRDAVRMRLIGLGGG